MAEETTNTETVKTTSSGTVKITVEEYNDLQARANKPTNVTYNRIEKTAEMAAQDNVMHGALFMGAGATTFVIGAIQFYIGKKGLKAL